MFREYQTDGTAQKTYLNFLKNLLKDWEYVVLAINKEVESIILMMKLKFFRNINMNF